MLKHIIEVDELRKGAGAAIMDFHKTRNTITYQSPFPPLSEKSETRRSKHSSSCSLRRRVSWTDTRRTRAPNNPAHQQSWGSQL